MRPAVAPLVLLLATLATGCADDDGPGEAPAVDGVPWTLAGGLTIDGWESVAPSATFAGGRVSGSSGCNRYAGSYTAEGDRLELGPVAGTRMACPPPADAVERQFLARLERVAGWRLDGEELVLRDDEGGELLRFRESSPLGEWEVTAIRTPSAVESVIGRTRLTARLSDDGELTGSAGCNTYESSFTAERGTIEIGSPVATKKACAEPAGIMAQEAAFLDALQTAARYRVDGRKLTLERADGTIAVTLSRVG